VARRNFRNHARAVLERTASHAALSNIANEKRIWKNLSPRMLCPCSQAQVYRRFRGACCLHRRAIAQKTATFIFTALRTLNLTEKRILLYDRGLFVTLKWTKSLRNWLNVFHIFQCVQDGAALKPTNYFCSSNEWSAYKISVAEDTWRYVLLRSFSSGRFVLKSVTNLCLQQTLCRRLHM
jgi:hypothetical protein